MLKTRENNNDNLIERIKNNDPNLLDAVFSQELSNEQAEALFEALKVNIHLRYLNLDNQYFVPFGQLGKALANSKITILSCKNIQAKEKEYLNFITDIWNNQSLLWIKINFPEMHYPKGEALPLFRPSETIQSAKNSFSSFEIKNGNLLADKIRKCKTIYEITPLINDLGYVPYKNLNSYKTAKEVIKDLNDVIYEEDNPCYITSAFSLREAALGMRGNPDRTQKVDRRFPTQGVR